jgi:hypothetical protein
MAVVINGSGTVTGISVGGLPDGIVDAGTLATNSVDSAELVDGGVDASHLAGGDNTPSFCARVSAGNEYDVANGAYVQMTYDTEDWDTDSAFASNTFTVPSGEGGKYLFVTTSCIGQLDSGESYTSLIRVNDASKWDSFARYMSSTANEDAVQCSSWMGTLSAGDTVKAYMYHVHGSALQATQKNRFSGCKLSGV